MKNLSTRILSAVIAVLMIVGSFSVTAFAAEQELKVKVSSISGCPGDTVSVRIELENNPGISSLKFNVNYDDANLILTSVAFADGYGSYVTAPEPYKNPQAISLISPLQEVNTNGLFATLTFSISASAKDNVTAPVTISYDEDDVFDGDYNNVRLSVTNGLVNIYHGIPGDIDGDRKVNNKDAILLFRYVAGWNVTVDTGALDCNGDGKVNNKDAITLFRYVAGWPDITVVRGVVCNHTIQSTEGKAATCTESGNIPYWHCTTCGKYFSNAAGTSEIALANTVIQAKGHTVVIDSAVVPTFNSTGLTEGSHCSVCKKVIVPQNTIPALTRDEYSITYHVSNNDNYLAQLEIENPNPVTYTAEEGLELQDLIVDGYTFEGWFDGAGSSAKQVKELPVGTKGNKVLYARWSRVTYTVQFDCPLDPIPDATYTVDKGVTLSNPEWFGYTFVGWSDNDGNIISSISEGTTGNITLKANWTSKRNQTRPVKELGAPIIYEDEENAQILFTYEIGTIENVPLYTIKDFGRSIGYTVTESITTSNSISKSSAETIAEAVSNATTKSSSWTLSKDWNRTTSISESHTNEVGSEVIDAVSSASSNNDNWLWNISKGTENANSTTLDAGISAKVSAGTKDDSIFACMIPITVSAELSGSVSWSETDSEKRLWNTNNGFNQSETSSSSHETSKKISSLISDTHGYGETYSEGGSKSTTQAWANSITESREYATALTYSNAVTETITKTYSNPGAPEGFYRLVCAGKVHVFAVVGYDIASSTYYIYTYSVMDDETTDFMDYSKLTSSYDDYENGVLPFEVPYEINDYIDEIVNESKGLIFNIDTGKVVGYCSDENENENAVIIPWYKAVSNGDGTRTVFKVTGFESDVFKGNEKLVGIKLGKYVTEIPDSAFEGCSALNTVVYSSIDSIVNNAFAGCTSITSVTVPDDVTSLGANAFDDVPKVTVNAANAKVVETAVYSGAKQLILNLSSLSDELENKNLKVSGNTDYFEFNGNNRTYKNICIVSDADTTIINGATFENTSGIPFTFSSRNVTLNRVNATSQGLTMILSADKTNVGLFRTAKLISNSGNAVLSKNMALSWANPGVAGSMNVSGNVLVCGQIDSMSNLEITNGTIKYITQEEFDQWNNSYFVYFDPNGGTVSETVRQVNFNSSLGVLPVPTKTGYSFDGWYTADNTEITSETIFESSEDITVYAKWSAQTYTVSWYNGIGYEITVTRTSSPYAGTYTGTLGTGSKIFYGDVLSIKYTPKKNYHLVSYGATSITVTGNVTAASLYATAELTAIHVRTVTGYADRIHYYMEVYTVGNQLYIKGSAYDTTNHNAQLRIDINSTYATVANLYSPECSVGGYHGFDFMCGPYSGNIRIMIHTFLPDSGQPIKIWDSFEDPGYLQSWVSFPS